MPCEAWNMTNRFHVFRRGTFTLVVLKRAVKAAQSLPQWWLSSSGHGRRAILSFLGSALPTGRNLCYDLARKWMLGISPSLTAAAPESTAGQCFREVRVCTFTNTVQSCYHPTKRGLRPHLPCVSYDITAEIKLTSKHSLVCSFRREDCFSIYWTSWLKSDSWLNGATCWS